MLVGAAILSADIKYGIQLWVFPLRNLVSCEAGQHGGKRKPQLWTFFPLGHANGHNQPEPVHENKL